MSWLSSGSVDCCRPDGDLLVSGPGQDCSRARLHDWRRLGCLHAVQVGPAPAERVWLWVVVVEMHRTAPRVSVIPARRRDGLRDGLVVGEAGLFVTFLARQILTEVRANDETVRASEPEEGQR
jgi:hypothetical protein